MADRRIENEVFETIKVLSLSLTTIEGRRIDLIDLFLGLQLFESVFESFLSGKVLISDTTDMYKNESLSGNELISMTFQERSTGIQSEHYFRLYKIGRDYDVTRASSKSKILECYFYSEEKQIDNLNKISRKYWDLPNNVVESVVRDVFNSEKALAVEYASELVTYYSGFKSGSAIIDFMARNATSVYGERDYIFFESLAGFHFVPLSFLMSQTEVENLLYLSNREMSFRIDDMQFFEQNAYFDLNIDASRGVFGKTLYKLKDGDRYGIVKTAATYGDNSASFRTNGRNLLFSEALFNENNAVMPHYHNHEVSQVRSAVITTLLHNNKLMVRTQGTLDRKVGDILKVEYPNQDNIAEPNTSLDGSWIILSIKHSISNSFEYTQNMMLAKNARNTDDNLPATLGSVTI